MADTKISELPAATTPLAGTEEVAIVQGANTKKVAVSNLVPQVANFYQSFTATNAQTSFTLSQSGIVATEAIVTVNGLKQIPTTDYTISGTTLTIYALATGDILEVYRPAGRQGPQGPQGNAGTNGTNGTVDTVGEYTTTTPTAPVSGVKLFARARGGRRRPAWIGPSGLDSSVQTFFGANKIGYWGAQGNSNTAFNTANPGIMLFNFGHTASGTATTRSVATTNLFTSMRRLGFVSAATAGSVAGTRYGAAQFWRGNAAGLGGFDFISRHGFSQVQTGMRSFVGLWATATAITNVEISTLTNFIALAQNAAHTNLQIMHNDGSGTATIIDLGANFPGNTANTDMYDFRLFCPPNASSVFWSVTRLNTGHVAEGEITTDLPSNTTLLSPQVAVCNGATAAAVAVDVVSQYIETDY